MNKISKKMQLNYFLQYVSHFFRSLYVKWYFESFDILLRYWRCQILYYIVTIANLNSSVTARREAIWLPSARKQSQYILTYRD